MKPSSIKKTEFLGLETQPISGQDGFILAIGLFLIAALMLLALSLFSITRSQQLESQVYVHSVHHDLAFQSALTHALHPLQVSLSNSETEAPHLRPAPLIIQLPPAKGESPTRSFYMAEPRVLNADEAKENRAYQWKLIPLFSRGQIHVLNPGQPLFSPLQPPDLPSPQLRPRLTRPPTNGKDTKEREVQPAAPDFHGLPMAGWVSLESHDHEDTSPTEGAESAISYEVNWWIEDLEGYLDGNQLGNNGFVTEPAHLHPLLSENRKAFTFTEANGVSPLHIRLDGSWAREIPLSNLLSPALTHQPQSMPQMLYLKHRHALQSTECLSQLVLHESSSSLHPWQFLTEAQRVILYHHLAFQLKRPSHRLHEEVIPTGLGLHREGQAKIPLNPLLLARDVQGLAHAIQVALPRFSYRVGGSPSPGTALDLTTLQEPPPSQFPGDYLKTLAANVIDYADPDDVPTQGDGYRGSDSHPVLTKIFDRYAWIERTDSSITLEIRTFVEFRNISQKIIQGQLSMVYDNGHSILIGGPRFFSPITSPQIPLVFRPNEYHVIELKTEDGTSPRYTFTFQPPFLAPSSDESLSFPKNTYETRWKVFWNGHLTDELRGGAERTYGNLAFGDSKRKWKGNGAMHLNYEEGQYDDPRMNAIISSWIHSRNYDDNSRWGGRNQSSSISQENYRETYHARWPDGEHDGPIGFRPTDAKIPTSFPISDLHTPEVALARFNLSPDGRLRHLTELGHVFDPVQWRFITGKHPVSGAPKTPIAHEASGGGTTLRIGQPDFPPFQKDEVNANRLLDLFTLVDEPENTQPQARVNLNTAPREVLRALATGIILSRDPGVLPETLRKGFEPPSRSVVADLWADSLIASRPLRSVSDLPSIHLAGNPGVPFFGNADCWPEDTRPASWSDAGKEELFSKLHALCQTQSRNFRVWISIRSLTRTRSGDSIAGPVRSRVYHVYLNPETQKIETIHEKILSP